MSLKVFPNSPSTISASDSNFLNTLMRSAESPMVLFNLNWDIQQVSSSLISLLNSSNINDVNQLTYKLGFDCITQYEEQMMKRDVEDKSELSFDHTCKINSIDRKLRFSFEYVFEMDQPMGRILKIREMNDMAAMKDEVAYYKDLMIEQKKQLKRYKDSNVQLENFAYIASHDLREPVRTINNFTQLLSRKMGDKLNVEEKEYFQFIKDGVNNMDVLINDLLTYSRVNTGEHKPENLNLENLLLIILNGLNQNIIEQEAEIIQENIPDFILGSKTKIKQLFQNLIANAIKFKKADIAPKVVISGAEDNTHWKFSISDNGIGIKPEYFEKIFMIFKKLHSKHEFQGSGIGLAICKKIVEQHDGEIWVESTLNEGTTFFFTIAKLQAIPDSQK